MTKLSEVKRAELVWAGKYEAEGNLKPVDRTILPFQTVETVNESKADRDQAQRDLFTKQAQDSTWRNQLVWGDNKIIMSSLLPKFAGKIALIYIDPPFATGQDFSFRVRVGDEEFMKEPSIIEDKAYRDTWGRGLDSYLQMMYERLILMRELLAEDGSIYIHIGPDICHYIKALMDDIFDANYFINDIVWKRTTAHGDAKQGAKHFDIVHDMILLYSKGLKYRWNTQYIQFSDEQIDQQYNKLDENGRRYRLVTPTAKKPGGDTKYEFHGVYPPEGRYWAYKKEKLEEMHKAGLLYFSSTGQPYIKYYLDERPGVSVQSLWSDIPILAPTALERVGYATQKPESLLERIIKVSSNKGDLVADFFCGSGTTLAVAEKLGRRWIGTDLSKWAIQVARKRLLQIEECRPFELLNLGNYERHKLLANGHMSTDKNVREQSADKNVSAPSREESSQYERYLRFVLELYRAETITGFKMVHGKKGKAFIHVGSVDSPITMREIRETLKESQESADKNVSTPLREVHFLGWDFEMGLHDLVNEVGEEYGVKVRLVSIPKEALEVSNPAKEEVRFFDLNYLDLSHEIKGKKVTVKLKDFIIANPEYLPEEVRDKIKKFGDYIDYWSVDWDFRGDTFHNGWQSFRTRKEPKLETSASNSYEKSGKKQILVKVVDIFGNDTTKMIEVKI